MISFMNFVYILDDLLIHALCDLVWSNLVMLLIIDESIVIMF